MTRVDEEVLLEYSVRDPCLSDHFYVHCQLSIDRLHPQKLKRPTGTHEMLTQMFFAVTLQILHSYLLLLRMCLIYAHNTQRLHNRFGFKGKVLDWFRSYLENRT